MNEENHQPVEPGWNHQPGDPDDIERWWTGADWSEYTRPAPQQAATSSEGDTAGQQPDASGDDIVSAAEAAAVEPAGVAESEEVFDLSVAGASGGAFEATSVVDRTTEADGTVSYGATAWNSTPSEPDDAASDFATAEPAATASPFDPSGTGERSRFDTTGWESSGWDSGTPDSESPESDSSNAGYSFSGTTFGDTVSGETDSADADSVGSDSGASNYGASGFGQSEVGSDGVHAQPETPGNDVGLDASQPAPPSIDTGFVGWSPSNQDFSDKPPPPEPIGPTSQPMGQYGAVPPTAMTGQPFQQPQPDSGSKSPFGGLGAKVAGSGSAAAGFMERIRGGVDTGETGWDRNLATLAWIPALGGISVIAYAVSGSRMSLHARSHIAGAFNYALSTSIMVFFMLSIRAGWVNNVALGVVWWFVLALAFGGVVFLLSQRDADRLGQAPYWIWYGAWAFVALMTAVFNFGIVLYAVIFGSAQLVVVVVNLVRGRLGMESNFLGYPTLPILSQR